jgi:hypothetical protein
MSDRDVQAQGHHRRFSITVRGRLRDGFAETIGAVEQVDLDGATTLSGELRDQSQLHGMLERLRDLGVDILRFDTDGGDAESA